MNIQTLLDSYNSNTLWEMAREAQLPATTGKKLKKAELITLMAQEFFQPARIEASFQRLAETEKAVLNRLLLHGGRVSSRRFQRELIRARLVEEAPSNPVRKATPANSRYQGSSVYGRNVNHIGQPLSQNATIFEDIIARLTLLGLVFSAVSATNTGGQPYKLQFHPANTLIVPAFVRQHLPEPEPLLPGEGERPPAHTLHGDPQLILRDLYLYWDTVRRNPIPLLKSGLVSKRGMKQLNDNLLLPDATLDSARSEEEAERLFALRQILQALELVQAKSGELQAVGIDSQSIPQWWQKTTTEQIEAVIAAWKGLRTPVHLHVQHSYYVTPNLQVAVQHLLAALAEIPANTWIDADLLLISLQDRDRDFLFFSRSRLEDQPNYFYYGDKSKLVREMDALERTFLAQAIGGYLFQMGLVELGFENQTADPTQWRAFRLTPFGAAVFKGALPNEYPDAGQIIIQPNFQILALGPVPLSQLARLDLFAERQKVDRSAFEYLLSRESVYVAQQTGLAVSDVAQFLTAVSPNGLPQNIQKSLAEWAAHHERIVFRRSVTLLQAADEALLKQLIENEKTGKWLARPVGNRVALVKTNRQPELVAALQAEGHLPAVSGANPEAADSSVTVHEDGRIKPVHAVPSVHLRGRLARFTAEAGGEWLLTETAVRRAGGSKKKAQAIIDELRRLHRGRLPETIVERVKAWGGYYGSATVATMTLVEFRDQETLAELCRHPDLKDLLQPFPAGNRALAVVDGETVTAVQTILARLGVTFTPPQAPDSGS